MNIGPGTIRRATRGNKHTALVLRPLTIVELKKYGYFCLGEDEELTECTSPAWMTLHLETGDLVPHGEDALMRSTAWIEVDV